jgi:hypothetical protein
MSFKRSIIPLHIQHSYIYTWRNSPCFPLPLLVPFCSPFVSPFTYLAPSSCDRNRPPPSQVACKLTPFAPPFTQLSHPFQIPRTPTAQRLTRTTSGIFRILLSGTLPSWGRCWMLGKPVQLWHPPSWFSKPPMPLLGRTYKTSPYKTSPRQNVSVTKRLRNKTSPRQNVSLTKHLL